MSQPDMDSDLDDAYADGMPIVDVLGGGAKVRILAVLITEYDRDLNPSQIYEQAGIGSSTFYNHIDDLRRWELVEQTRMAGNSPMYQMNKDSEAAERLANFEWELIRFIAEKEQQDELDEDNRPILGDDE
jgi:DNA-binding transcriptional ArsR family regulator